MMKELEEACDGALDEHLNSSRSCRASVSAEDWAPLRRPELVQVWLHPPWPYLFHPPPPSPPTCLALTPLLPRFQKIRAILLQYGYEKMLRARVTAIAINRYDEKGRGGIVVHSDMARRRASSFAPSPRFEQPGQAQRMMTCARSPRATTNPSLTITVPS